MPIRPTDDGQVRELPRPAQLALARAYREQEELRALVIAWYWLAITSWGMPWAFDKLGKLMHRAEQYEWVRESKKP